MSGHSEGQSGELQGDGRADEWVASWERGQQPFAAAAQDTLARLREHFGWRDWRVVVRDGDRWSAVAVLGEGADGGPGPEDCAVMAASGPVLAPLLREAPDLLAAAGPRPPGAWAGAPIVLPDGRLAGAVCGSDPLEQPADQAADLPVLQLGAALLAAVLHAEQRAEMAEMRALQAEAASLQDPLTGLGNRRMWDRLLVTEEERCRRLSIEAAVVVVDLDGLKSVNDERGHPAGDTLLRVAATVLTEHTRIPDQVARTGGDEFAIVATDCAPDDARALVDRLRTALNMAGVTASIGQADRRREGTLTRAWIAADEAMYAEKRRRRRPTA